MELHKKSLTHQLRKSNRLPILLYTYLCIGFAISISVSAANDEPQPATENQQIIKQTIQILPFEIEDNNYLFLQAAFQRILYNEFMQWPEVQVLTATETGQAKPDLFIGGRAIIDKGQILIRIFIQKGTNKRTILELDQVGLEDIFLLTDQMRSITINSVEQITGIKRAGNYCYTYENSILFLVDNSGSMKDNSKMEYAKKLIIDILSTIPQNSQVAMMTFQGDYCTPGTVTKLIQPFSKNPKDISDKFALFAPANGTPLATALVDAKVYLEKYHQGKKGRIILIGDGQDDCGQAKTAVKELQQTVYDIRLDSVGIDLKNQKNASEEYNWIAAELGGSHLDLNNGDDYSKQIGTIFGLLDTLTRESAMFLGM